MRICKAVENIIEQQLRMRKTGNVYLGHFLDLSSDEIVRFRCSESSDEWGIARIIFECVNEEDKNDTDIEYTLDQMLEACYRDYKPLGNEKVVQYVLEISSMYDDKKQDNAIEMFINDSLQKAYRGIKVVSFERTTSLVSEEYYK